MGGFGSGSWQRGKPLTTQRKRLDIRDLQREALGLKYAYQRWRDGASASISFVDDIIASVETRFPGQATHRSSVELDRTRLNYGWAPRVVAMSLLPCACGRAVLGGLALAVSQVCGAGARIHSPDRGQFGLCQSEQNPRETGLGWRAVFTDGRATEGHALDDICPVDAATHRCLDSGRWCLRRPHRHAREPVDEVDENPVRPECWRCWPENGSMPSDTHTEASDATTPGPELRNGQLVVLTGA
jgi:hypothetical protein